jgi:hypothetical protein
MKTYVYLPQALVSVVINFFTAESQQRRGASCFCNLYQTLFGRRYRTGWNGRNMKQWRGDGLEVHGSRTLIWIVIIIIITHSWSWALLEKLPIVQLLENFPAFYETQRFITAFT